jgi:hypothetical protein
MIDLIPYLNRHSSRRSIDEIATLIGESQALFDTAIALSFSEPYPINMRASWAISHCCDVNPSYIQPHLDKIALTLSPSLVAGVKRNYIRIFAKQANFANMEQLGRLIDVCFDFFNNPAETIAVRAFCLDVILKIGKTEPDLIPEIIQSIEFNQEFFSAGLKNKSQKVIATLLKFQKI